MFKKKDMNNGDIKDLSESQLINKDIELNIQYIKSQIGINADLIIRHIPLIDNGNDKGCIIYLNNLIDDKSLNSSVLMPFFKAVNGISFSEVINNLPFSKVEQIKYINLAILEIFKGKALLLIQNSLQGYLLSIESEEKRSIQEPTTDKTLRGSKEGFTESISSNVLMIRRKLPDYNLVVEELEIGVRTKTKVAVIYIKDIANEKILNELKNRISSIDTDGITASGMLEQYIEDNHFSVFPQIQNSERPDRAVNALLEGRICIICNGTPVALMVPAVFVHFIPASEDYYDKPIVGSFNRFLRYMAIIITLTLPSIYIALTSFHPELLPFVLVIPLAEARKEIPFPPVVEAFLLEIMIEFLREMGIRLPQPIGNSLGVVGGIVLGDAAIRANLVTPTMVIVVGATAVISFVLPNYNMVSTLRLLRFPVMIMSGLFGVFGITTSMLFILVHLIRLESFGIPYLSPFAPVINKDIKDTFYRAFLWNMKNRPQFLEVKNKKRVSQKVKENGKNE